MKRSIIAALLTAGTVFSLNAATLIPMNGVSLLYINGQQAESKIKPNEVASGKTQVVLRMDKKLGRGSSQSVYTSAPYVLTLDVSGDEVKINHPVARSKQEAEAAFRQSNPQWRVTQDGNNLSYSQEKLKGREGMLPYMDLDELVTNHNEARGIKFGGSTASQAVESGAVAAVVAPAVSSQGTDGVDTQATSIETNNVEQLKSWYLKSSKAERKEFRKWMIDQE